MGAWDVGSFADDTALDVRDAWVEPIRRGRSPADVTAEILGAFGSDDPVVWLALADTQWRWGRLEPLVQEHAVTPTSLDASTRWPHPVFTLGAFRKGERPARRLSSLGASTPRHELASHRLSLGIRWTHFDGFLASTFDLPPQPRRALGSLLPFLD
jgi:hypothetical protein